jgi:hypothetical protein
VHIKDVTASPSLNDSKSCQAAFSPARCREVVAFAVPYSPTVCIATAHLRSVVFNYLLFPSNRLFWRVVCAGSSLQSLQPPLLLAGFDISLAGSSYRIFGLAFGASLCIGLSRITTLHRVADESRGKGESRFQQGWKGGVGIYTRLFPLDLLFFVYFDRFCWIRLVYLFGLLLLIFFQEGPTSKALRYIASRCLPRPTQRQEMICSTRLTTWIQLQQQDWKKSPKKYASSASAANDQRNSTPPGKNSGSSSPSQCRSY